jgi:hypothetical protein
MRAFFASWRSGAHVSYRERMHAELDSRWADAAQAEASKFALVISRLEAELGATRCGARPPGVSVVKCCHAC